jgi:outer membrane protein assembly factor BamE (lipoprotein component of BamABCDE complex)
VLLGIWLMIVGYEFLEKENARFQKNVKVAKEEQRRCEARLLKFRSFDQLRAGMSESEVEIILGAPDYARCDVSKQGDKFVGSTWMYAVAVPQDVANDSQNSGIQIVFGPDGKLTDKNAMNMQAKPSPTPSAVATPAPSVPTSAGTPAQEARPSPTVTPQQSPSVSATPVVVPSATPATAATPSPTPQ